MKAEFLEQLNKQIAEPQPGPLSFSATPGPILTPLVLEGPRQRPGSLSAGCSVILPAHPQGCGLGSLPGLIPWLCPRHLVTRRR